MSYQFNPLTGSFDIVNPKLTGSEIKTLYEGEENTNAFTDAEKSKLTALNGDNYVQLTGNQTITGIKTFTEKLLLPNCTFINDVAHFYQTERPTQRVFVVNDIVTTEALVIGDKWTNSVTGEVGTFNGTYFLGRRFVVGSNLAVINTTQFTEDTSAIFLRDVVVKGMVSGTPNWSASNNWRCHVIFNEVYLQNLGILDSSDGFTNVNSNVYKKFTYNSPLIATASQRGNNTVIVQTRSTGSPTGGSGNAGTTIQYLLTFFYIL